MTTHGPPPFDAGTYRQGLRVSPAFERNRGPIIEALRRHLPQPSAGATQALRVLEVASGPGEHVRRRLQPVLLAHRTLLRLTCAPPAALRPGFGVSSLVPRPAR